MDSNRRENSGTTRPDSFKAMTVVPKEVVQSRMEPVKTLEENDTELYEVMKDGETGEHYLHFVFIQVHLADAGARESFHHLLPLRNDDVLAIVLGEQPYAYPKHWREPYLRYGINGDYVWFDPSYAQLPEEADEQAKAIVDKLRAFKRSGTVDPEDVANLLNEIDRIGRPGSNGRSDDQTGASGNK